MTFSMSFPQCPRFPVLEIKVKNIEYISVISDFMYL